MRRLLIWMGNTNNIDILRWKIFKLWDKCPSMTPLDIQCYTSYAFIITSSDLFFHTEWRHKSLILTWGSINVIKLSNSYLDPPDTYENVKCNLSMNPLNMWCIIIIIICSCNDFLTGDRSIEFADTIRFFVEHFRTVYPHLAMINPSVRSVYWNKTSKFSRLVEVQKRLRIVSCTKLKIKASERLRREMRHRSIFCVRYEYVMFDFFSRLKVSCSACT